MMEEHVIKKGCTPEELEVKQMARDGLCRNCKGTDEGLWDCGDEDICTGFKDECDAIARDEEGTAVLGVDPGNGPVVDVSSWVMRDRDGNLEMVGDPHAATAARIFDVVPGGVTEYMHRVAKTVNFRELYGSAMNLKAGLKDPGIMGKEGL